MWSNNHTQSKLENKDLDRFGDELLNALEASEAEINTAATSPFLYRRIRVRIEAEEKRRTQDRTKWFALLTESKHAIPVLAMVACIAIGFLWYSPRVIQAPYASGSSEVSSQAVLSSDLPVSSDEVISSFVGWNERRSSQRKEQ